jgi:hypothetical protein
VEIIQEGTSTSAHNQNKTIYSEIFSEYAKWFRNAECIVISLFLDEWYDWTKL